MYSSVLARCKARNVWVESLGFIIYPLLLNISDAYCILADAISLFPLCEETLLEKDVKDTTYLFRQCLIWLDLQKNQASVSA